MGGGRTGGGRALQPQRQELLCQGRQQDEQQQALQTTSVLQRKMPSAPYVTFLVDSN